MPAKTKRQQRFMAMCSSPAGRKKAKGKCPPVATARKYSKLSDKAKSRNF